jgi:putative transposase
MQGYSVSALCRQLKRTRQSYYKSLKRQTQQVQTSQKLMKFVQPIRQLMPRLGGRKLLYMIQEELAKNEVQMKD